MKKNKTRFLVAVAFFLILVIIVLEFLWLQKTYHYQVERFESDVNESLKKVELNLKNYYQYSYTINKGANNEKLYFNNTDSFSFSYVNPNLSDSNGVKMNTKIQNSLDELCFNLKEINQSGNFLLMNLADFEKISFKNFIIKKRALVDSILKITFSQKGIMNEYTHEFINLKRPVGKPSASFVKKAQIINNKHHFLIFNEERNLTNNKDLLDPAIEIDQDYLVVTFKKEPFPIKELGFYLITALVITLLVAFLIFYLFRIIFDQYTLSEMKNDFINNMSHEFKTPLATIQFATANIEAGVTPGFNEKLLEFTEVIKLESKRLNEHVERILLSNSIYKKEIVLVSEATDLHQLIERVVTNFNLDQQKSIFITRNYRATNSICYGDKTHLTGVFSNLIDNAIKYSLNDKQITIETYNSNRGIFIKISDNGIGISKENLSKIFDKFYRVNSSNTNAIDGFGLGLAYVYSILTAHKGTITVESKLNEGSVFTVFIPITSKDN